MANSLKSIYPFDPTGFTLISSEPRSLSFSRRDALHPLSHSTGYAIRAMSCLHDPGGDYVPGQKVATWIQAPVPYLLKIFSQLGRAKLVATKRSRSGGIILLRPANEITLEQITTAMEGDAWRTNCLLHFATCSPESPCPVHAPWAAGRKQILQELQSLTRDQVKGCLRPQQLAPPGQVMPLKGRHLHKL